MQIRRSRFTGDLRLHGMVLRMITLNSLSAFAQEITRRPAPEAPRGVMDGVTPVNAPAGRSSASGSGGNTVPAQRTLDAAPNGPAPPRPLPRGSLLDLRV